MFNLKLSDNSAAQNQKTTILLKKCQTSMQPISVRPKDKDIRKTYETCEPANELQEI